MPFPKRLEGKRVAILVEEFYEDLELWYPLLRLNEEAAKVWWWDPAGTTNTGKHGYPEAVDKSIPEVQAGEFDAVVVPGYAPDHMRRHRGHGGPGAGDGQRGNGRGRHLPRRLDAGLCRSGAGEKRHLFLLH